MTDAKRLKIGPDSPPPTSDEEKERIEVLRATIEKYLPDFVRGVAELTTSATKENSDGDTMVLHQDSFAAGYDDDEYTLLGMAVKYAGLHGLTVTVIGTNHGTFRS